MRPGTCCNQCPLRLLIRRMMRIRWNCRGHFQQGWTDVRYSDDSLFRFRIFRAEGWRIDRRLICRGIGILCVVKRIIYWVFRFCFFLMDHYEHEKLVKLKINRGKKKKRWKLEKLICAFYDENVNK